VKHPMRQLAILVAAMFWCGKTVHADSPTIWFSESAEQGAEDKSMTVYPLDLEKQTRRTSFNALQPANDDESMPPPTAELPEEEIPLVTPPSRRPRVQSRARSDESLQDAIPEILRERNATRRSAPEELLPPPPGDGYYESDPADLLNSPEMAVDPWGGEPPAATWSSGEWFRSGIWYTNADFLVIRRDRPRNQTLIGIDVTNPDNLFFNYGSTGGIEPAMRLTLGRFIGRDWENRDHSVEVSFLGINEFKTAQGIRAQQEQGLILLLDQKQGGVNGADVWISDYSSRFHSVEADLRLRHRPDKDRLVMAPDGTWTRQYTSSYVPSLLLGMRYVNLSEDYFFRSRSLAENITEEEFTGNYDIETNNDLVGPQLGAELINQRERWYWGFRGKAGAFVNFAEQFTAAQFNDLRAPGPDAPGDPSIDIAPRDEHATRANEAFFGEVSVMAAYHFTPNFTARASYDFMWLAGVALAPDQLTFTETARLALDGTIFYQGLSVGLEIVW
jgi:hypothetical protein